MVYMYYYILRYLGLARTDREGLSLCSEEQLETFRKCAVMTYVHKHSSKD